MNGLRVNNLRFADDIDLLDTNSWDHADLTGYYASTGTSVSIILKELDMVLLEHENRTLGALKLQNHIDKAYEKIVEDLRSAAECSVPPVSYTHLTLPTIYSV